MSVSQFPLGRLCGSATKLRRFSHIPLTDLPTPYTGGKWVPRISRVIFCVLSRQMRFSTRFSRVIPARNMRHPTLTSSHVLLRDPQIQFRMLGLRSGQSDRESTPLRRPARGGSLPSGCGGRRRQWFRTWQREGGGASLRRPARRRSFLPAAVVGGGSGFVRGRALG